MKIQITCTQSKFLALSDLEAGCWYKDTFGDICIALEYRSDETCRLLYFFPETIFEMEFDIDTCRLKFQPITIDELKINYSDDN